MSLFTLIGRRRIRPAWQYTTRGTLWGLYPTREGMMVGEERDLDTKTTSFFCVDQRGFLRWKNKVYGETWWTGIEAVHADVLLLHGYATPDLPEHKGVIAVRIADGEELWRNSEVTLLGVRGEEVHATRKLPRGYARITLALQSGAILRETDASDDISESVAPEPGDGMPVELPRPLLLGDDEPTEIQRMLGAALEPGREIAGTPEFIERPGFAVFAFSTRETGKDRFFEGVVSVVARDARTLLYRDTLGMSAALPGPMPVMMRGNIMHYVRDRKTLVTVSLPG